MDDDHYMQNMPKNINIIEIKVAFVPHHAPHNGETMFISSI